jgi:2-desacetyl-2-hydroxyethyl bacteriochlorophyllide A dehydrogenase
MKTPAVVFREANQPQIEDVAVPDLRPDEVRVRTHFSGISIGTERSLFSGSRVENGSFPFVGGYMAAGVVEAVGEDAGRWQVGQRVVTHTSRLEGEVQALWGGHAGVQTTHHDMVSALPEGLDFDEASMFILSCVAFNAVTMAQVTEHDRVLIQGQGLIGQMFGQVARNRGARLVTVEPNPDRAALSRRYVTDDVLTPDQAEPDAVAERFGGTGPSVVVEATGVGPLRDVAAKHVITNGRFVSLAWYPGQVSFTPHQFHARAATVLYPTGSGGPPVFRAVLDAMSRGALVLGDNLTHRLAARDAVAGYRQIIDGDPSVVGMTLDWSRA